MRIVVSLLLILLCNCYYLVPRGEPISLYKKTNSSQFKQCFLPVYYFIGSKLPQEYISDVKDEFDYWNGVARDYLGKEKPIFIYGGTTELIDFGTWHYKGAVTTIEILDDTGEDKKRIAATNYKTVYDKSGCIGASSIKLYLSSYEKFSRETVRTAIRHEIGHVLGLGHSERPTDLMYGSIEELFNNKVLSDWEIEAFKAVYK